MSEPKITGDEILARLKNRDFLAWLIVGAFVLGSLSWPFQTPIFAFVSVWTVLISWGIRDAYRSIRGRRMLEQVREVMTRRFTVTGEPIRRHKIALFRKKRSGVLELHPKHWNLPWRLRATTFTEADIIVLVEQDYVTTSSRYKEKSWIMPRHKDIEVSQVRWTVNLFDIRAFTKTDLGTFIGKRPKVIEKSMDSNQFTGLTGEVPLGQLIEELQATGFLLKP